MKKAKPLRQRSARGRKPAGWDKFRRIFASRVAWCVGALASVIPLATGGNMLYELYVAPLTKTNVTGRWCVTDVVRKAQHEKYIGMKLVFEFNLKQDKNQVSGNGRKISVDGAPPAPIETSWIDIKHGHVSDKLVTVTFIEANDARRDRQFVSGTFVWAIRNEKTLEGTFDVAAGGSSGDSTARLLSGADPRASCRDAH